MISEDRSSSAIKTLLQVFSPSHRVTPPPNMTFTSYLLSAAVLSTLISTTSASPVVARSLAAPAIPADISDYAGRSVWRFSRTAIDGVDDVVSELLEFAKVSS